MSDDDDGARHVQVLLCEVCSSEFPPERFGQRSGEAVPLLDGCPNCGGDLLVAGDWADWSPEDG